MNWPPGYNLPEDYCADVLGSSDVRGCYDLPYEAKTVLDIGANVGAFARWAHQRWPVSLIHCYEPQPENYSILRQTVSHYVLETEWLKYVITHNLAVAPFTGKIILHENGNRGEWSASHFEPKFTGQVEVDTIDAADLPTADFIKIDTEGMELLILQRMAGAGKLASVNAVVLEYHSASHVAPIISVMQNAGLALGQIVPHLEHRGILKFLRG